MDTRRAEIDFWLKELHSRYAIPRKKAAQALAQIGTPAVIPLINALRDRNPDAQLAAVDALERIGTRVALAAAHGWKRERGLIQPAPEEAGV